MTENPRSPAKPHPRLRRRFLPALGLLALLGLSGAFAAGCVVHPAPHHHRHARAVVVASGHVHGARCGHYRHRGAWYHLRGHHHGPRCGHFFVGGFWVLR